MKRGPKRKTTDSDIKQLVQDKILVVVNDEFSVARTNMQPIHRKFNEYYNLLHCIRMGKEHEWENDIALPEFASRLLTQIGDFVSRYFSSRDFVDVHLDSEDPKDVAEAKASKRLLNSILSKKDLHYFHKIVRLLMFSNPLGYGIIRGNYRQNTRDRVIGYEPREEYVIGEDGNPMAEDGTQYIDQITQRPARQTVDVPITVQEVIEDRPDFDVFPIQNVYFDMRYTYSMRDKEYIYFTSEETLDSLESCSDQCGYFNLHMLKDMESATANQTGKDTWNKDKGANDSSKRVLTSYIIRERWGLFPLIVEERDEKGRPIKYKPGLDKDGNVMDKAEFEECIITSAGAREDGDSNILIRFQASPYTVRPIVRFLCYIDAINDCGFGDGELVKELSIANNDMLNLSNYRVRLATTPAFKVKRWSGLSGKISVSPETPIELEHLEDLQEIVIKDNIQGSLAQISMISNQIDRVMATYPHTMGDSPDRRETATMGSIIEGRAQQRTGMKLATLEHVGFVELYDMILSLVNDFMLPETLEKLLGQDAYNYNPSREDRFIPVSQAIETEESKQFKLKMWDQMLAKVVQFPNPKTAMVVNYIIGQQLELLGDDFRIFKKFMFEEDPYMNALYQLATGSKGTGTPEGAGAVNPMSNQMGLPQGNREIMARNSSNRGGM